MDGVKSIVHYQTREYGHIRVKLAELLDGRGITRNRLRTLTGVKYEVIDRYYKGVSVEMADLDFFGKGLLCAGLPGGGSAGIPAPGGVRGACSVK